MKTASELKGKILSGEIELGEYFHSVLSKTETEGKRLNYLISLTRESALQSIEKLNRKLTSGETKGKLFGLPILIKDNICFKGARTTCGSTILVNFIPPYNATVVDRLIAEDAVIIGKTNMDEFAMGSSNENSAFGPVLNPHDITRTPGGSSGGSAAAVAAGVVPFALGSDTGGSIRQPAALCGVVGLKPTYGSVSRYGLVAFASSMDQIGPLAADVESAAMLFDVIAGHDPADTTSAKQTQDNVLEKMQKEIKGVTIGLPREYFAEGLDREIRESLERVVNKLKSAGAVIKEVSLPNTKYAIATYYIIADAEASSNLARFDGVKYGMRSESDSLFEMYTKTRQEGFGAEVKRRIMLGTYVLSSGYYDAYYAKAMRVRRLIKQDFLEAFKEVDVLLTPTAPTTAFKLGEKTDDPLAMYLSDIYTAGVNLAGLPAMSQPCGKDRNNLPIGLQLIGKHFDEGTIFQVGSAIEKLLA